MKKRLQIVCDAGFEQEILNLHKFVMNTIYSKIVG